MTKIIQEKLEKKLRFLQDVVNQLTEYQKLSPAEYNSDPRNELAVERLFQTCLEAVIDTARLLIIEQQLEKPLDNKGEFEILSGAKIISSDLANHLSAAKRFRNVLVHDYVTVDTEQVYRNLQEGLEDIQKFQQVIAQYLLKNKSGSASDV